MPVMDIPEQPAPLRCGSDAGKQMESVMKKLLGLAALMLSLTVPGALAGDTIDVRPIDIRLGNSQVIGPLDRMATVIVGNDGVVGASLGGGGTIILTGKVLGTTNLIVLDEQGQELLSSDLNVVSLDNRTTTTVRISRGIANAQTYECGAATGCSLAPGAVASVAFSQDAAEDVVPSQETAPEAIPEAIPEANPVEPDVEPDAAPQTDVPNSEELISLNP